MLCWPGGTDWARFLHLDQFNEFAGQPEGAGYGPKRKMHVDTSSADLTDDFKPTSLTASAYRGKGGRGYHYLNRVLALVDLYRQPTPRTRVLAICEPLPAALGYDIAPVVTAEKVAVRWVYVGGWPKAYSVSLDGKGWPHISAATERWRICVASSRAACPMAVALAVTIAASGL